MLTVVKFDCIPWARASSIVIASILLIACGGKSVEIVDITDTGVTESQIVQTKVFDQCASASALKAEVQFSKSNEQESAKELIIKGGIEGEAAIPFTAKAQLEGGVETHLKSLNSETTGHQESTTIEVPAHSQQEYAITWREIYRKGEISYIENGQTKVATFSARIGVELAKTTVRDLGCPDQVASNQLSTPIPTYTPVPIINTFTSTQTPLPATDTPSTTATPVPPTKTATKKPTNSPTATFVPVEVATISPSANHYYKAGLADFQSQNYTSAITNLTFCVQVDPLFADCFNLLGQAYRETGNYSQAILNQDIAIALNPRYDYYFELGVTYHQKSFATQPTQFDKAIADFNACIELNPTFSNCFIRLGMVYRDIGDYTQALLYLNKAIEFSPERADFYWERGLTYQRMGDTNKANADFQKAQELGYRN